MDRRFQSPANLLLLLAIFSLLSRSKLSSAVGEPSTPPTELPRGFRTVSNPSFSSFQPLLRDPTGNYSLGFRRIDRNELTLSVIHVPSSLPFWSAKTTGPARWADPVELLFNGSLILSSPRAGIIWSTDTVGDYVRLSDTSNLQIQTLGGGGGGGGGGDAVVVWQSFDFPSDTLVENQNFTTAMSLTSSNGLYSMRLGSDFFGLYTNHIPSRTNLGQIYLKHGALEAKADIIQGQPIHLILMPDGYLGMFQNGTIPVDVESFNSFQQNLTGSLRLRLEPDGNLKGYFWTGSAWEPDYQAISDPCELPSSCGTYGLCRPGKPCSCLDNTTVNDSGVCSYSEKQFSSDFCGAYDNKFKVTRRKGVELPFKELMQYSKMESREGCESTCEENCTCWAAVYSNSSGFCYMLESPIQTFLAVDDDTKTGYFKVRQGVGKKKVETWIGLGLGLLFGAIVILAGVLGLGWYKVRNRGVKGYNDEEGVGVGPYKDLGSASFRSIELCEK